MAFQVLYLYHQIDPNNFLVAAFGGSREGNKDVTIWLSKGNQSKWNSPILVANGVSSDRRRYPNWNPVLFKEKSGELFLFYKIGPSPREWWGAFKTSSDQGNHWSEGCIRKQHMSGVPELCQLS